MTLSELRALMRLTCQDATAWPDATLDAFIGDAIRFYSAEYPRLWRHEIPLATGTQAYDLPGGHGIQGIVSVAYPAGEDPAQWLARVDEWRDAFANGDEVYALRGVDDSVAPESDAVAGQIVFAETVTTGETAIVSYLGAHTAPTGGDDAAVITVPAAHLEALTAFVEFRAHWELETDEALTVSSVSVVLSQLGEEARRAWNRYREVMDRLAWLGWQRPAAGVSAVAWGDIGL